MTARLISLLVLITHLSLAQKKESIDMCPKEVASNQKVNPKDQMSSLIRQMQELEACMLGKTLPEFYATSRTHGSFVNHDLKEKVVLLNFWFIGCHPCEAEMPLLNELYEEYRNKDFLLLSFSRDEEARIPDFLKEYKINFPIVPDASSIITGVFKLSSGYPTTIILNKKGEVVEYKSGGPLEAAALKKVKAHLNKIIDQELEK